MRCVSYAQRVHAVAALLLGCTPAQTPVTMEVSPAQPHALEPQLPPPPEKICERSLRVVAVHPATPTCQVFGLSVGARGSMRVPCNANGPVTATIGSYEFSGTMTSGVIQMENVHSEDIHDGCQWRFTQQVTGAGEKLTFQYSEEITSGTGCYGECGAVGEVAVVHP